MNEPTALEISWGTILRVALAFFIFYLVYLVRDILVFSVFGLMIAILFEIPIRFLEKKIPRVVAVIFLYLAAFSLLSLLIYLPASRFIQEIRQFVGLFPVYFEQTAPILRGLGLEAFQDLESFATALEKTVRLMTVNIFNVLFSLFGSIAATVFVISIAIFLSLEGRAIEKTLVLLFPKKDEEAVLAIWQRSQKTVGLWFLRTLISCFFVWLLTFIAFYILKTKYPLSLSVLAGALNFIPVIGPIFATLLIFVIVVLDSWGKAFFVAAIMIIIQQVENNIFTPLLTKKFIHLSPALVLISLTVGAKLFGFWGAILTVPLVAVVAEFLKAFLENKRNLQTRDS